MPTYKIERKTGRPVILEADKFYVTDGLLGFRRDDATGNVEATRCEPLSK